ncbi:MAG: FecR domain-containing protein [Parabacteroides sp.]|nr:FecR domain-containing protein [Parabacteroides sp.]
MNREVLYKFFEGTASYEEEVQVRQWMEYSPENRREFLKERKLFDSMLLLGDEKPIEKPNREKSGRNGSLGTEILKIAAVVAVTLGLSFLYQFVADKEQTIPMQSIYVPSGQRVNLTLSGGTNVWLNARTRILYPAVFDKSVRQVTVDGEAYFDVAKDKQRPFIVETNKCKMEVLGTKFNVEGYSDKDDFEVTLMEGRVKVASKQGIGDTLILTPDSKACLEKDGRLTVVRVDDYNPYHWKEGLICFRTESFLSIMNDLEKYFGVSIVVENKAVLKYNFTGKFRQADGIDYALRVLQKDIRFRYERDDENQIIYIR